MRQIIAGSGAPATELLELLRTKIDNIPPTNQIVSFKLKVAFDELVTMEVVLLAEKNTEGRKL